MAIKGSLKAAGLADVCQLLAMGQKTGCLSVTDRSRFGQIYFDRGRITFATIVNRRDRLGDLLVRKGSVTHEQLREAVEAQAEEPDRRLGELLLERGYIDTETLRTVVKQQIKEAIFHLFTWKRGSFHFEAGKTPGSGEILIAVNPEMLLLEGARRVDEWSIIEEKIPSTDVIFGLDLSRVAEVGANLTREQEAVIRYIDGKRTLEELAEAAALSEFATGKALYGLLHAGYAHRVGRREAGDTALEPADLVEIRNLGVAFYETAMLDDAEREFRRVLAGDPHDDDARHYLALIALRQGAVDDAVRGLAALLEASGPRVGAFLNLAFALRLQGRYGDALRALDEAERLAPDDVRIALAQGATRLHAGETREAAERLAEYRRRLGPDRPPPATYYHCAGLAALVEGRLDDAASLVEEGLGAHPASAPLHNLAGNVAEGQADMAAAESAYRRAAEEDATLAQPHRNLGDLANRRGNHAAALDHYRRAAELNPELGDELYTRLAELHYRRNERQQAIECWRKAVALNPDNEVARNHLEVVARATS